MNESLFADPGIEIGIQGAADILGVHANTVRNWISEGKLRSARPIVGGSGFRRLQRREVEMLASARRDKLLTCARCNRLTTRIEADQRVFNTGRCGHCDGALLTAEEAFLRV